MTGEWNAITGLVEEIKRCEECEAIGAAVTTSYVCMDTLASLARPVDKPKVTRSDFIDWVDSYLQGHADQPYQYRGKDVYAARCAVLHTYGVEAELHGEDPDIRKFGYHDGGRHSYDPSVDERLVMIGTGSFLNDVVHAVRSFLEACKADGDLRSRVEERLPGVLQTLPLHA